MLIKGVSRLCGSCVYKLSNAKYFSNIFILACVLCIYRRKLVNPCLFSIVNDYTVNQ